MSNERFCMIYGLLWLIAGKLSSGWFEVAAYVLCVVYSVAAVWFTVKEIRDA